MKRDTTRLRMTCKPYKSFWNGRKGVLRTYNLDADILCGLRASCIEWQDGSSKADVTLHSGDPGDLSDDGYTVYWNETVPHDRVRATIAELIDNAHKYITAEAAKVRKKPDGKPRENQQPAL